MPICTPYDSHKCARNWAHVQSFLYVALLAMCLTCHYANGHVIAAATRAHPNRMIWPSSMGVSSEFHGIKDADVAPYCWRERWRKFHGSRESFMVKKLFCTISKILMCWKLSHETPTETAKYLKLKCAPYDTHQNTQHMYTVWYVDWLNRARTIDMWSNCMHNCLKLKCFKLQVQFFIQLKCYIHI